MEYRLSLHILQYYWHLGAILSSYWFFTLFLHIAAAFKMNYGIGDDRPSPFPWLGYHRSPAVPHHPEMIHILGL
jgi:hypothetical protein